MYNILVCDDERDIVSALQIYLESDGYNVLTAFNGKEALDVASKNEIHLIKLLKLLKKVANMDLLTYEEIDELLAQLGDTDCGENCEYDELYLQLDELALGTPSSQMGDSYIDGKEPDYRTLYKNCVELFKKTHDLRVASFFTLVLLHSEGLEGLKKGLKIKEIQVEMKDREFGESYLNPIRSIQYMINMVFSILFITEEKSQFYQMKFNSLIYYIYK